MVRNLNNLKPKINPNAYVNESAYVVGEVEIDEVPFENHSIYLAKGEIMFYPGFESMKEIVIPYDKVAFASKAGLHPANHFATIEDLSADPPASIARAIRAAASYDSPA